MKNKNEKLVKNAFKNLSSSKPTVVFFLFDKSSSMKPYKSDVEENIKWFRDSLKKEDETNVLFIIRADFSGSYAEDDMVEIDNLRLDYMPQGKSILYYAICRMHESLTYPNEGYISVMENLGYSNPNIIIFILTDGVDEGSEGSGYGFDEAKECLASLNKLDNINTYCLLFGNQGKQVMQDIGLNVVEFKRNKDGLKELFNFASEKSQRGVINEDSMNGWFSNDNPFENV